MTTSRIPDDAVRRLSGRGREVLARIAVAAVAVLVTLLVVEIGYRVRLRSISPAFPRDLLFHAANASIYEYHEDEGYRYVPEARMEGVCIRKGAAVVGLKGWVNKEGNVGIHDEPWVPEQYRVLVVGDSFTANPASPEGPITWTDYLPEALGRIDGKPVAVKNYARDGYGVAQILHMAVAQGKRLKPDLIVIAFIADDLTRGRSWRTTCTVGEQQRLLVCSQPGSPPDLRTAADMYVLNPGLTADLDSRPAGERDHMESALLAQYEALLHDNLHLNLSALTTSFLYHRIAHGDPFHGCYQPSRNPRVAYWDYAEDELLVRDIEELKRVGCPFLVVHIPTWKDIRAQYHLLKPQETHLLESLECLLGEAILRPLSLWRLPADRVVEELFFLPFDIHPNRLGARAYAQMIAAAVQADRVQRSRDSIRR
jgi:hypothetical protein